MKKNKLLILALAAFSSVAIAAVGCDNGNNDDKKDPKPGHEHTYTWQSDDDSHWQACTAGDDTKDSSAHVDVVVKATGAAGSDGLCDVCERVLKYSVVFDLNNGKGMTPPPTQKVEYGSKATAPMEIEDDGYTVVGWYTDAACSVGKEFDFATSTVTADVTLFAKWELTTPDSPTALPIADNAEFVGSTYNLRNSTYGVYIGDGVLTITGYDETTRTYTVKVTYPAETTYLLTFADNSTIEFKDADGNLLDTLKKFKLVYNDLPDGTDTIDTSLVQKNMYLYKAVTAGWYKIEWTNSSLAAYYNLDSADPTQTYYATAIENGQAIYLNANDALGVYFGGFTTLPATVTFTVSPTAVPAGYAETDPLALVDGKASLANVNNKSVYYFSYTAPATADYYVSVYYSNFDEPYYTLHYVMKGEDYGYLNYEWKNISSGNPYASIKLTEGETLIVAADVKNSYSAIVESLTVSIFENITKSAAIIDVAQNPSGDLTAGDYRVQSLSPAPDAVGFVLTSDTAFTVTTMGKTTTGTRLELTEEELSFGFSLQGSASYSLLYMEGTINNPIKITRPTANGAMDVMGEYVEITAPSDSDVIVSLDTYEDFDDNVYHFYFEHNNVEYGYNYVGGEYVPYTNTSLTVAKGTSVKIKLGCKNTQFESDYTGYPVIVVYDYTQGAKEIDFTAGVPENDEVTLTSTVNNVSNGDNLHIENMDMVYVTGNSAFTLLLNNGTSTTATRSEDGTYLTSIYSAQDLYFKVETAAQNLSLTFSATYERGSDKLPYDIELEDGVYESRANGEYFKFTAAGTYYVSATELSMNGQSVDSGTITVEAGAVLYAYGNFTVKYAIAADYLGRYSYTDSDTTKYVYVKSDSVIVDGTEYSITAVSGNVYTLKAGETTTTLTLSATEKKLGETALAASNVFTQEQATTYNGVITTQYGSRYDVTLTLNQNGVGVYSIDSGWSTATYNIVAVETESGYQFTYGRTTVTFSWDTDGVLQLTDSSYGEADFGENTSITYSGTLVAFGDDNNVTIEIEKELSELALNETCNGTITDNYGEDPITITKIGENQFTFTNVYESDGAITLNDDGSLSVESGWYGEGTLIK